MKEVFVFDVGRWSLSQSWLLPNGQNGRGLEFSSECIKDHKNELVAYSSLPTKV